jgi:hypothetical protein
MSVKCKVWLTRLNWASLTEVMLDYVTGLVLQPHSATVSNES